MSKEGNTLAAFSDAADALLEQCTDLRDTIRSDFDAIVASREECLLILTEAFKGCSRSSTRTLYERPRRRIADISECIVALTSRVEGVVLATTHCANALRSELAVMSHAVSRIGTEQRMSADQSVIVAHWRAAVAWGPPLWKFYSAVPTLLILDASARFLNLNLAFLGRPPNTRVDLSRMLAPIQSAVKDGIVDSALFGGCSLTLKILESVLTAPSAVDIRQLQSATVQFERVERYSEGLGELLRSIRFASRLFDDTESAVSESIELIQSLGGEVTSIILEANVGGSGKPNTEREH